MQRLLAELKRRNVLRVAAAYGATAFVIIEAADLVLPRVGLPEQAITAVVWTALLLFPVTAAVAWFYDLEAGSLRTTIPAEPGEIESIVAEPRRRRWPIGILALAGTVLLLTTAWFTLREGRGRAGVGGEADPNVIVVLPFDVHGPENHDYLGVGLVDLLTTRMDGVGPLRTVPARSVLGKVRQQQDVPLDSETSSRIAAALGAGRYIQGEVLEAGGQLSISATLSEVDGDRRIEASVDGTDEQLLDMVDDLTAELVAGLEGSASGRVRQLAALTTTSLPALKAYLHGEELLRAGQFTPALAAFDQAVELDSTFSLAHYRLSIAREWSNTEGATEAADDARRHAGRLSERDRLLVEAMWTWRHGDGYEAEDLYRTVLGRWPDDMEAWFQLAEVKFHFAPPMGGHAVDAKSSFERVLEYEPEHLLSLWHLVRLEAREGHRERADSLVALIERLSPEGDRTLEILAMTAALSGSGDWPVIVEALRRAQDITPYYAVWNVAVYSEDIDRAMQVAGLLTEPTRSSEVRATGYLYEAILAQAAGRSARSADALDAVERIDGELAMVYRALRALQPPVQTGAEDLERFVNRLEEWSPPPGCVSTNPIRGFEPATCMRPVVRSWLLGMLYARLGWTSESADAVAALEEQSRAGLDADHAQLFIPAVRAEVVLQRGDTLAALKILEAAPRKAWYVESLQASFYAHGLARYRLAELLDAVGRTDDAIRWYGSFDEGSTYDLVYRGPAEVRIAELLEVDGRTDEAAVYFAGAVELLDRADGPFVELAERARAGLARTRPG